MAEGDMSDVADDVDEDENNGGDRNLYDYEIVSLILKFHPFYCF